MPHTAARAAMLPVMRPSFPYFLAVDRFHVRQLLGKCALVVGERKTTMARLARGFVLHFALRDLHGVARSQTVARVKGLALHTHYLVLLHAMRDGQWLALIVLELERRFALDAQDTFLCVTVFDGFHTHSFALTGHSYISVMHKYTVYLLC